MLTLIPTLIGGHGAFPPRRAVCAAESQGHSDIWVLCQRGITNPNATSKAVNTDGSVFVWSWLCIFCLFRHLKSSVAIPTSVTVKVPELKNSSAFAVRLPFLLALRKFWWIWRQGRPSSCRRLPSRWSGSDIIIKALLVSIRRPKLNEGTENQWRRLRSHECTGAWNNGNSKNYLGSTTINVILYQ